MRVYFRTGRISVDSETANRLLSKADFSTDEVTGLRQCISHLIQEFCKKHSRSLIQLCFADWVIGREFCSPEAPKCNTCPISEICTSWGMEAGKMLIEPKSNQGFY